jgi:hypothetical protein
MMNSRERRLSSWSNATCAMPFEAGMITSAPKRIITEGTDWRFFNETQARAEGVIGSGSRRCSRCDPPLREKPWTHWSSW